MQINIIDLVPVELRKKVITLRSSNLSQRAEGVYQMYHDLMHHQSQDWVWPTGHMKELLQKWLFKSDFRQYSYQKHEVAIKFIEHVLNFIQNEDLLINELDQQKQECLAEIARKKRAQEELLQQKTNLEQMRRYNHITSFMGQQPNKQSRQQSGQQSGQQGIDTKKQYDPMNADLNKDNLQDLLDSEHLNPNSIDQTNSTKKTKKQDNQGKQEDNQGKQGKQEKQTKQEIARLEEEIKKAKQELDQQENKNKNIDEQLKNICQKIM